MRILTWNVNSIRQRHERLLAVLARHAPDVVCLQETKVVDADFPVAALRDAGYHAVFAGQKAYNGVAILAKSELREVELGLEGDEADAQARLIAASVAGVRVVSAYAPNGQTVGSEKYAYKLAWYERLRKRVDRDHAQGRAIALCGDFNVAPADQDVHDPVAWRGQVLCSEPERAALRSVQGTVLRDAFRSLYADKVAYTWWDYRQLGFPKNRGLRIDHVLLSESLALRLTDVVIDREERKGKGPSDHVPVMAVLA